ncbi:hypothetical protein [Arthrobacter humicola]
MNEIARLTNALAAAARAFLRVLDDRHEVDRSAQESTQQVFASGAGSQTEYDPLLNEPPITPRLKQHGGSEREDKMVTVAFLGAVARLNAELGTGATAKDIHRAALRAGYPRGGQDVVGWVIRPGRRGAIEVRDDLRYLGDEGHKWLRAEAANMGIVIKGDITPIPIPLADS